MPSYDEVGQVTMDDIRHFDSDAKDLVQAFHLAHWHTYISTQGHVFCLAPDGVTTASVSRDSLRGRSGRNAAAKLKKWVEDNGGFREVLLSKHTPKKEPVANSAFGHVHLATEEPRDGSLIMTQRIASAIKRHPVARPWIEARMTRVDGSDSLAKLDLTKVAVLTDDEHPERWILVNLESDPPGVVATSDDVDEDAAMAAMREQLPDRFESKGWEIVTEQAKGIEAGKGIGPAAFVCDVEGCGKAFDTAHGLSGHRQLAHRVGGWKCQECGAEFKAAVSLGKHRQAEHGGKSQAEKIAEKSRTVCQWCGRSFATPNGRAVHERRVHDGEPVPEVTVTRTTARARTVPVEPAGDVTVTSPPVTPEPAAADVLLDHLLAVPTGDDAEAMVAKIRAVVSAPLVAEVQRLRTERDDLAHQNTLLAKQVEELETRMSILREAMSV